MLSKASNQTKYQMTAPILIFSRKLQTKDAQSGNKLVGLPMSLPRELTRGEPVQIRKQGSIKDLTSNRLGFIPCVCVSCASVLLFILTLLLLKKMYGIRKVRSSIAKCSNKFPCL